jgi:hypothetical protein
LLGRDFVADYVRYICSIALRRGPPNEDQRFVELVEISMLKEGKTEFVVFFGVVGTLSSLPPWLGKDRVTTEILFALSARWD